MAHTISRRSMVAGLAMAGVAAPAMIRSAAAAGDLETPDQKIKVEWDKPWNLNLVDSGVRKIAAKLADGTSAKDKTKVDTVILQDGKGAYLEVFTMPVLNAGESIKLDYMLSGMETMEKGGDDTYSYAIDKGKFGSKPYGRFVKTVVSADGASSITAALTASVEDFADIMTKTIEKSKVDGHAMFENVDPAALAAAFGGETAPAATPKA